MLIRSLALIILFQLTTSRRGRPARIRQSSSYQHFNSRPREEVDFVRRRTGSEKKYFNSRPREEVDSDVLAKSPCAKDFNSRPREEVDKITDLMGSLPGISTHDLAKRSTTAMLQWISCRRLFQLTTSRRGRLLPLRAGFHNLVFQLTTSRRGRRSAAVWQLQRKAFQLTTSRRGRQLDFVPARPEVNFNSRPREEVDLHGCIITHAEGISTHDLAKRSTTAPFWTRLSVRYFNSRPREEVDFCPE